MIAPEHVPTFEPSPDGDDMYWVCFRGSPDAIRNMIAKLPDHLEAILIVSPTGPAGDTSALIDAVRRETPHKIEEVAKDQRPQPNTIYVAPPDRHVTIEGDIIRLAGPGAAGEGSESLFRSMAETLGQRAVVLFLSGGVPETDPAVDMLRGAGVTTIVLGQPSDETDEEPLSDDRDGLSPKVVTQPNHRADPHPMPSPSAIPVWLRGLNDAAPRPPAPPTQMTEAALHARIAELEDALHASRRFLQQKTEELADTQAELRQQRELYLLASNIAQIGCWRFDPASQQIEMDGQALAIHGLDPKTGPLTLKTLIALHHADDQDLVANQFILGGRVPEAFEFAARIVRPNGVMREVLTSCLADRGPEGERRLAGVTFDITDLQIRSELEATVDELYRSNEELGHIAYACSHDIKEPLRLISQMVEMITDPNAGLTDEERRLMQLRIGANASRLGDIFEGLLTLARSNPLEISAEIDAIPLVKDICEKLGQLYPHAQGAFEIIGEATLFIPQVHLRSLLQNLIGNAVKYGAAYDLKVRVTVRSDGSDWRVIVEDNGAGVPMENRAKIFNLFERLDRSDETEGSGLGLPICARIVNQLGGDIHCGDSPLGGAAFRVRIPKGRGEVA